MFENDKVIKLTYLSHYVIVFVIKSTIRLFVAINNKNNN